MNGARLPVSPSAVQRHLPKPVACPKAPANFSDFSRDVGGSSTSSSPVATPTRTATGTPATAPPTPTPLQSPFAVRKTSFSNVFRRASNASASNDSGPQAQQMQLPVAKNGDTKPKPTPKESKSRSVLSAIFGTKKRGNRNKKRDDQAPRHDWDQDEEGGGGGAGGQDFGHQMLESPAEDADDDTAVSADVTVKSSPAPTVTFVVVEPETFALFKHDSEQGGGGGRREDDEEEEELPYVPTTLPIERPVAPPITPVRVRMVEMAAMKVTSVERPRCSVGVWERKPCSLDDYLQNVRPHGPATADGHAKIQVKLPSMRRQESDDGDGDVAEERPRRAAVKTVADWNAFVQEGLTNGRRAIGRTIQDVQSSNDPSEYNPVSIHDNNHDNISIKFLKNSKIPSV